MRAIFGGIRGLLPLLFLVTAMGVTPPKGLSATYSLITTGATWKFLDNGSNQGTSWVNPSFDDLAWNSGPAQLGYGDGDEATVVSYGPSATNKYVTTYFRRTFNVPNPSAYSNLTLRLLCDDGAVVYLNGTEVHRANMPAGTISYTTLASTAKGSTTESTYAQTSLPNSSLATGANVVAVEIHQATRSSSDISFNLELTASGPGLAVAITSPTNNANNINSPASLNVAPTASAGTPLTVTYYGRAAGTPAGPDFTVIALPDTQYYASSLNGGTPAMFVAQTDWILSNKAARNIVYMAQLGDCVENGDSYLIEWQNATNALYRLEDPVRTGLAAGLPYGVAVGNHDQSPKGDANGTTTYYNQYFGASHFAGRQYYGGYYGTNSDNFFELFSASGLDFVVIYMEYNPTPDPAVLSWANNLLQTYNTRRGIVVSHYIINGGNPASFGTQGQSIYNALKGNPNLFLMLSGHISDEGQRLDIYNGNMVYSLLSDYQGRPNGGNGWLRIMEFSPSNNVIRVQTYSPTLNQFETNANSHFTLNYNMQGSGTAFLAIQTNANVMPGANDNALWAGLAPNTGYEWYAAVSDGVNTATSPVGSFRTASAFSPEVYITAPANNSTYTAPANVLIRTEPFNFQSLSRLELYEHSTRLGEATLSPYDFAWNQVPAGNYSLTAVAYNNAGASATSSPVNVTVTATNTPDATLLTRGPYLQLGTPSSMVVRWRTDLTSGTRLRYGTNLNNLNFGLSDTTLTNEHVVQVTNLQANTKYFYQAGTAQAWFTSDTNDFFVTSPPPGAAKPTRLWVIGDSGTANTGAQSVRDAYLQSTVSRRADLWLMLGDNAYNNGTDSEYQTAVFNMYPMILQNTVLWPTIGNHDTASSVNPPPTLPYFNIFNLPTTGEAGGLASGTEKYYSFDYANVHFICLDSMSSDRSTNGLMLTWLRNDLAVTMQDWIIAFWHHPPYSKGSHNSDTEAGLIEMRSNVLPILEAGGVDLVLSGHSHSYERSFLIKGHYGLSSTFSSSMVQDGGSGRLDGTGAYYKPTGLTALQGTVYAVAGSSGTTGGGTLNHPAMYISLNQLGSLILDVNGQRLDARFIRETGAIADYFTILKPPAISVGRANGAVVLSWPTNAPGFALQGKTDLSAPAWNAVNATPSIVGDRYVLTNATSGASQLYRLSRP